MTHTEIYRAWHTLPEYFKEEVRRDYAKALEANELDPKNERIDAHIIFLEKYFGKHNLTATEEEKPRFKVGDCVKVSQDMDWGSETFKDAKTCFCNTPIEIVEIKTERATIKSIVNGVSVLIPLKDLIPYTEEQEPENDERVDFSFSSLQNRKNLTENEIPSMSKEDAEELAKCLAAVDDFIKENKMQQVDWLAYRMELAKEVVNGVMTIDDVSDYEHVVYLTMSIVDGIVERLKGGLK